ncbi:hypothetical protein HAX54_002248 [Datura stramonium]|uniref:Uncharacterized protein n=1 Tax=Datura stramonium TaxID=4076 RepID=A0ABS8T4F3_DATST|nr:hypothetical protein [Datura stramonium]
MLPIAARQWHDTASTHRLARNLGAGMLSFGRGTTPSAQDACYDTPFNAEQGKLWNGANTRAHKITRPRAYLPGVTGCLVCQCADVARFHSGSYLLMTIACHQLGN